MLELGFDNIIFALVFFSFCFSFSIIFNFRIYERLNCEIIVDGNGCVKNIMPKITDVGEVEPTNDSITPNTTIDSSNTNKLSDSDFLSKSSSLSYSEIEIPG